MTTEAAAQPTLITDVSQAYAVGLAEYFKAPFAKDGGKIVAEQRFSGGDKDFNVPVQGGEQMYQALQSLKVPTQLVIYPGQFHGLTRPSFNRDRLDRYVAWYDKWLKPASVKAD